MLISKWRARSHQYFGTIHVPIIELEIRSERNRFIQFSLCVDSGAVVSLLPRSAADVLGLRLSDGRPIQLGIIGGQRADAWVHDLDIRIANLPNATIPFAFANHDNVPGLLGRFGVFDRFEITFDPQRRETRMSAGPGHGASLPPS